ncbi:MAG: TrmH family RNA methyltransferase, partial [Spirochaetota bacterium]|nr:TrmH family RNA methyltransferase [Spirochaetota bacterium]
MITIRKLSKLPAISALRKSTRLLQGFELDLKSDIDLNSIYLRDLISFIASSPELNSHERSQIKLLAEEFNSHRTNTLKTCNNLRHILLKHLNEEPADWDLLLQDTHNKSQIRRREIQPFEIFLDDLRSPFNVGSIFRTSESFGISKITVSPGTASPTHKR